MNYVKNVLSGVAAIFIAQVAFSWSIFRPNSSKAIGLAALVGMSIENFLSPIFWIVAVLLFGLFFAASRSNTVLRVLFFWIPTLLVSTLGVAFIGMLTYFWLHFRNQ